jgi:Uma2 family endonuclease
MRLTLVQFALLCAENREAVLELASDGQVLVMTPTGSETGGRNIELAFQLQRFARSGTTWKAFACSTGFRLPDDSVLSPDDVTPFIGPGLMRVGGRGHAAAPC